MKAGRTHLAYRADYAVDLDIELILAAEMYHADAVANRLPLKQKPTALLVRRRYLKPSHLRQRVLQQAVNVLCRRAAR